MDVHSAGDIFAPNVVFVTVHAILHALMGQKKWSIKTMQSGAYLGVVGILPRLIPKIPKGKF